MTNSQTRMLSSAIGMVAGALAGFSASLDVNVSIIIILITFAMLIAEYVRSFKSD
jgi:phage shock protein PspC (stress-responsive transcriptional regulator)